MSKNPVKVESAAFLIGSGNSLYEALKRMAGARVQVSGMKLPILAGILSGALLSGVSATASPYCNNVSGSLYGQTIAPPPQVVYTAPVVYNAPVYYAPAVPAYSQVVYAPACPAPNVIITGRGAYHTSWNTSPTVIHFGSSYARHGLLPNRRCR